ncbi:MAG: hypothetical protein JWM44_1702 [Bacilli bacterium]|nr:hypothetical protein [Bacilli bacterium]
MLLLMKYSITLPLINKALVKNLFLTSLKTPPNFDRLGGVFSEAFIKLILAYLSSLTVDVSEDFIY